MCHIHRCTIRVSISVPPKHLSYFFYKATSCPQKSPLHSGASCSPALELSQTCHPAQSLQILSHAGWRVLLCSVFYWIQAASVVSNSYLILPLLPILHHKMPRHLSEDSRDFLGWKRAWEEAEPVKPEPLEHTGNNRLGALIVKDCGLITLQLHHLG